MTFLRWPRVAKARSAVFSLLAARVWPISTQLRLAPNTLHLYELRIFSQHGEDGILAEIFFRLAVARGVFVEISVGDGKECNAALFARHYSWSGLMLEGSELAYSARETYRQFPDVIVEREFITAENVANVVAAAAIPVGFDLLVIDIDGNDLWIWRALLEYRAKVVVIEYNASLGPMVDWTMPYTPHHVWDCKTWEFGASLAALESFARGVGYSLVGTESSGTNAFFVRDDLVGLVGFPAKNALDAYHAPHPLLFTWLWRKVAAQRPL